MKMPKFANEKEEQQWYSDNRDKIDEEVAQAMREGRTSRGANLSIQERIESMRAKAMNIRLPEEDLKLARKLADSKGLPYQTYIMSLLHEALQREANLA